MSGRRMAQNKVGAQQSFGHAQDRRVKHELFNVTLATKETRDALTFALQ